MSLTISKLATRTADDLTVHYSSLFSATSKPILVNALQAVITEIIGTQIPLSATEPDYERIMVQLLQALSEDPEWYDMLTAGTGHALTRMTASGIAINQFSIQRALQETFLTHASSDNSIYSATRMLGVRLTRKRPSRVNVLFHRDIIAEYYEIPAYNTFSVGDLFFFNRDKIVFKANVEEVSATLYQGLVVTETIISNGEPFQWFYIGNGNRTASDTDVHVYVDGEEWTKLTEGPWQMGRGQKVYYESTSARGDIELRFGNGDFGEIPPASKEIMVRWVETLGANGNLDDVDVPITSVTLDSSFLSGVTTSPAQNGDDEVETKIYRKVAPNLRAANNRAVRRADYRAHALRYPGIKDALFRGQAEVAPGRRSMMNVVCVSILAEPAFTQNQWLEFKDHFNKELGIYKLEMLKVDPVPVIVDIDATIYCKPNMSLPRVKAELTLIVKDFFSPKEGHLGYDTYLSDISDILNGRDDDNPKEWLERGIEYCVINSPTTDVILPRKTMYCKLGTLNLDLQYTSRGAYQGRLDVVPAIPT